VGEDAKGYKATLRPSGHNFCEKFFIDNGAAIPPNLLAIPNTESNSAYLRFCQEKGIKPHPARFPADLPNISSACSPIRATSFSIPSPAAASPARLPSASPANGCA